MNGLRLILSFNPSCKNKSHWKGLRFLCFVFHYKNLQKCFLRLIHIQREGHCKSRSCAHNRDLCLYNYERKEERNGGLTCFYLLLNARQRLCKEAVKSTHFSSPVVLGKQRRKQTTASVMNHRTSFSELSLKRFLVCGRWMLLCVCVSVCVFGGEGNMVGH